MTEKEIEEKILKEVYDKYLKEVDEKAMLKQDFPLNLRDKVFDALDLAISLTTEHYKKEKQSAEKDVSVYDKHKKDELRKIARHIYGNLVSENIKLKQQLSEYPQRITEIIEDVFNMNPSFDRAPLSVILSRINNHSQQETEKLSEGTGFSESRHYSPCPAGSSNSNHTSGGASIECPPVRNKENEVCECGHFHPKLIWNQKKGFLKIPKIQNRCSYQDCSCKQFRPKKTEGEI